MNSKPQCFLQKMEMSDRVDLCHLLKNGQAEGGVDWVAIELNVVVAAPISSSDTL